MSSPDLSYVIPFRNWGLNRILLAARTATAGFGSLSGEVIVSDYGSDLSRPEATHYAEALSDIGAKYVRTETGGPWSITRATNAGVAASEGRVIVKSDADMLVQPGALERAARVIEQNPRTAIFFSCRDLPSEWDDQAVIERGLDWEELMKASRPRARWGMGLNAVSREAYVALRGWDERMLVYGGDDNDFSKRLQRSGVRLYWPTDPAMAMFHMWHESTAARHQASPAEAAQVLANKQIVKHDSTWVRNRTHWTHPIPGAGPLVSVVIATFNRRALLMEAIASVRSQSLTDFEIVVVDDGSTDGTAEAVAAIDDARVRYAWQPNGGVARARNRGTDMARAPYVAVLDDDDIAPPWRLEAHFEALTAGVHATFGAFVNFDDQTGVMTLMAGREMDEETVSISGGAPGHSTWMVERELMRRVRYDERLSSGVDNDLALRLVRSGAVWAHTQRIMALRRVHSSMITKLDSTNQLASASSALNRFLFTARPKEILEVRKRAKERPYAVVEGRKDFEDVLLPYLPDHLVQRSVHTWLPVSPELAGTPQALFPDGGSAHFVSLDAVTWPQLAELGPGALEAVSATRVADSDDKGSMHEPARLDLEAVASLLHSQFTTAVSAGAEGVVAIPAGEASPEDGVTRMTTDSGPGWLLKPLTLTDPAAWAPGSRLLFAEEARPRAISEWARALRAREG